MTVSAHVSSRSLGQGASVIELKPRARQDFTSSLGMMVFLASWAMMFSTLFFAYAFLRARAVSWPPPDVPALPVALPALNTLVLLASSFTFQRGIGSRRRPLRRVLPGEGLARSRRRQLAPWVLATFALGFLFLGLQLVVWRGVWASGLTHQTGIYGGIFYGFTVLHALHVVAGLLVLLWVFVRTLRLDYTEHNVVNVRLCAMFWHFVDVVWVLMFVTLYLL